MKKTSKVESVRSSENRRIGNMHGNQSTEDFNDTEPPHWNFADIEIKREPGLSSPEKDMHNECLQSFNDGHHTVRVKEESDRDRDWQDPAMDGARSSQSRREVGGDISLTNWWPLAEVKEESTADPVQDSTVNEPGYDLPNMDVAESPYSPRFNMNAMPKLCLPRTQLREQLGYLSDRIQQEANRRVPMHPATQSSLPRLVPGDEHEFIRMNQEVRHVPHYWIPNRDAGEDAHYHDSTMDSVSRHRLIPTRKMTDHENLPYCHISAQDARESCRPLNLSAQPFPQWTFPQITEETLHPNHRTVRVPVRGPPNQNGRDLEHTARVLHVPTAVAERKNHTTGHVPYYEFPSQLVRENVVHANLQVKNVTYCRQTCSKRAEAVPVSSLKMQSHPMYGVLGTSSFDEPVRFSRIGAVPDKLIGDNTEEMRQVADTNFVHNTKNKEREVEAVSKAGTNKEYSTCRNEQNQDEPYRPRLILKVARLVANAEDSHFSHQYRLVPADKASKALNFKSTHAQSSSENSDVAAMALEYKDLVVAGSEGAGSRSADLRSDSSQGLPPHTRTMAGEKTDDSVLPDKPFPPLLTRMRLNPRPLVSSWIRLPPLISCALCRMNFTMPSHLMAHCRAVHGLHAKYCLPCSRCGLIFSSHEHLKRHLEIVHKPVKKFSCPRCSKLYTRKDHLKEHVDSVHSDVKKNDCQVCGKRFAWKSGLRKHVDIVHGNKERVSCSVCDKTFTEKRSLKVHEATFHAEAISYECPHCEKSFRWKSSLKKHLNAAHDGGDKHLCPKCGQMFTEKGSLQAHLDRVHSDIQQYSCPECKKAFFWKSGVTKHVKAVHSNVRHRCPVCKKLFTEKGSLKRHMQTLHDEQEEDSEDL